MPLTNGQLATLKAAIVADGTLNAKPNNADGNTEIAAAFNLTAAPAFTVWKTKVAITEVGDNIVATELAGLSTLNATRLQTIAVFSPEGVNPSLADRRSFFSDVFSGAGGVLTTAKLLALWKRLAKRGEKLYATGTGTDASPATLTFEGLLTFQDVEEARRLP
jgi:hypothetical protein